MAVPIVKRFFSIAGDAFSPLDYEPVLYLPASGLRSDGAADFDGADDYLSIADNSDLSMGDIDFEIGVNVYLDVIPGVGTVDTILSKFSSGNEEYRLCVENGVITPVRFKFEVRDTANTTTTTVEADTLGTPSTGTWYTINCYHDSVNNEIGIQVNDGGFDTASHTGGCRDSTNAFNLGREATGGNYMNGRLDSVFVRKALLTAAQRTEYYNSGSSIKYNQVTFTSNLVSWWGLDEGPNTTRADQHGTNDLAPNGGGPGSAAGIVEGEVSEGSLISTSSDLALPAQDATQPTITKRPTYDAVQGAARYNTSQNLTCGDQAVLKPTDALTIAAWVRLNSTTGYRRIVSTRSGNESNGYLLSFNTGTSTPDFLIGDGNYRVLTASEGVGLNTWAHICGTWNGSDMNIYINGINKGTASKNAISYGGSVDFKVGSDPNDTNFMDGYIDEVFMKDDVLTADEITQLYDYGHPGGP